MPQVKKGRLINKQDYYMKVQCNKCPEIFEIPYSDRVNVFLFGNSHLYHKCKIDISNNILFEEWL